MAIEMDREVKMTLGGDGVHLWATDADDAKSVASRVLVIKPNLLTAHWSGLTRPGSYDTDGSVLDDSLVENTGRTLRRYTVKAGK